MELRVLLSGAAPVITAPMIFGVHPGTPFLFDVTAAGDRPMTFGAAGLPKGLTLNTQTGMITGSLAQDATYDLTVSATNPFGSAVQNFRIVVGDKIELTPAMGWNSWTVYQGNVTEADIAAQAGAMASSGLVNYGWTDINVDAGWEGGRAATGSPIQGNANFSNIPALSAYIHSLQLKFGLYTTPMPYGYVGDAAGTAGVNTWPDAQQFAAWGVDYLKYDGDPPTAQDIMYMSAALRASGRDIALSISVAGGLKATGAAFYQQWAQYWRVGADITDYPVNVINDGISLEQPWASDSGPGGWNDPDVLEVGVVGNGGSLHQSGLTYAQQQSQISIWAMDAAPLLLGNDMTQLNATTMSLLTNEEVLKVDQDPLGIQSQALNGNVLIQYRPLADGSTAVELINIGTGPATIPLNFADLGLNGPQIVRDLWQQADVGTYNGSFSTVVQSGATALITLRAATPGAPRIVGQPMNTAVNVGQVAIFNVTATGAGLTYQWTKNGVVIAGANSATLITAPTTAGDDQAVYRCVVTNSIGRVISYSADLSVRGLTSELSDSWYFSGTTGYYSIEMDQSATLGVITIGGVQYAKGIGTHSPSTIQYLLDGKGGTFTADVGIDDDQPGLADFQVWLDGVQVYDSGVLTGGMAPVPVSVDVHGAQVLQLIVVNGGPNNNYDRSDWANASITTALVPVQLPTVSDVNKEFDHDTTLAFSSGDFTGAFGELTVGDALQNVQIESLPVHGTLLLAGVAIAIPRNIPLGQLSTLTYVPNAGFSGTDSFIWNATDHEGYALAAAAVELIVDPPVPPVTPPDAPVLTAATAASTTSVNISWTDGTPAKRAATIYTIYYQTGSDGYASGGTVAAGGTSATVSGLIAGTTYSFKVVGTNVAGDSQGSNIMTVATTALPVVQPPTVKVLYADDRGPLWTSVGTWGNTVEPGRYYGNGHSFAINGHGADVATWTFSNLTPGIYRISATWRGDTNRATNAPFSVSDGGSILTSVRINQQNMPASFTENGISWGDLGGTVNLTGHTLIITLSDNADLYVDADAIRIEWVSALPGTSTGGGGTTSDGPAPAVKVYFVDDRNTGWASVGNWGSTVEPGRYYGDDHSFAIGGGGADAATWTFSNLTPGTYRVSATWRGDTNRATNAPFTVYDGLTSLGTTLINQQLAPSSLTDAGFNWGDIGTSFRITGTTLIVKLTDNANLYVDADAIRIEWISTLSGGTGTGTSGGTGTGTGTGTGSGTTPVVIYADDRGSDWSTVGSWGNTVEPGLYYGNGHSFAIGGGGADVATWTFSNLTPGIYRVSATWRGDTNRATNAPFTILNGTQTLATVLVNQQQSPSGLFDAGFNWSDLGGPYTITGSTLVVKLSDNANLYVDADAIRIERIG